MNPESPPRYVDQSGEPLDVVGQRIRQPDALAKATGAAEFVSDIRLPRMLAGRALRCPFPHAIIKSIDTTKAARLPGVHAVLTSTDVAGWRSFDRGYNDLPYIAGGELQPALEAVINDRPRHFGDAVAAVAASDEFVADEALALIEVEYEPLPFVLDVEAASAPGAPLLHEGFERNLFVDMSYDLPEGDVDKALEEADLVLRREFKTSKQEHSTQEPAAAVAQVGADGSLSVWSGVQNPHFARRELAHIFDLPINKVSVISPFVGGKFGQGLSLGPEALACALAFKTRRPVRVAYSREENFIALETRCPSEYVVTMGFKRNGVLLAMKIETVHNLGAYSAAGPPAMHQELLLGLGHYRCPNRDGSAHMYFTNVPMGGAMRGVGNTSVMWGVEQVMDEAAEGLGIDPLKLRLANIKRAGELSNYGVPIESMFLEEAIRSGAAAIGWDRERPAEDGRGTKKRGVGMATMTHVSGAAPMFIDHSNATIKFNEDGTASLIVHPVPIGTLASGAMIQIAAEVLGLRPEQVTIPSPASTDVTCFEAGTDASRTCHCLGTAVLVTARRLRDQVLESAAERLDRPLESLTLHSGQVCAVRPGTSLLPLMSLGDLCFSSIYNFEGQALNFIASASTSVTWNSPPAGAFFAEVEVDTETGEVRVVKFVTAMDCGTPVNPMTVEGSLEGGLAQGLGYALSEDYVVDPHSGRVETLNWDTYKTPGPLDMPAETTMIIVGKPDPKGPMGAKGVGECGLVGVAPAIANAVYDAIGVRIRDLPITPEKILQALSAR